MLFNSLPMVRTVSLRRPSTSSMQPASLNRMLSPTLIHADLIANNIGIAIITETWLKSHHANSQFTLPGYSLFRRDRLKRRGGGVAIYTKTGLHATILELEEPYDRNLELLWLRVTLEGHAFIVAAVYHPPKPIYQESELISAIERSLERFVTPDTRAHCWTISSRKSKKKNLFFTWPYRGHRRNPFFLSGGGGGVSVVPLKAVDYL